jgi:hypothetical protein
MINLVHREKLMIAELKKSVSFATGLKSQVEHVLVKRLRLREIVNFDSNMVAAIDLNIHPPIITLILRASSVGRMGAFPDSPVKTEVRIYDYVEMDHLDCVRSWRPQRPGRQDSWSDLRRQPNSRVRSHDGCIARKIHLKNDADRQANSLGRTSRIMNLTLAV